MENVLELRQERASLIKKVDNLLKTAEAEGRDLTFEENTEYENIMSQVRDIDKKLRRAELDELKANLNQSLGTIAARAYQPGWGPDWGEPRAITRLPENKFSFARAIRGLVTGRWDGAEVEQRALGKSPDTAGGYMVSDQVAQEVIDLLRPNLALNQVPGVQFLFPQRIGSLNIPRLGASATAYWVAENSDITESEPSFEQITLTPHKLAALISVSNELLADANPAVEEIIRRDLSQTLAAAADLGYLRGTGTDNQPLGIRNQDGIQTIAVGGALEYDAIVDAVTKVQEQNANPTAFICHPRVKGVLLKLKDGNGRPIFISDMSARPRDFLFGLPVIYTSQIPTNLGAGGNETEIYCVDGSAIIIAIWQALSLAASDTAAIWDATNGRTISAFQRDQTLVRAVMRVDVGLRHPEAVSVLTGIVIS